MSNVLNYKFQSKLKKTIFSVLSLLGIFCAFLAQDITVFADELTIEERLELQRDMEIQSDRVPNWPTGPIVSAESAILMEVETGTILYAKNIHLREYPASTTKILTSLIATEMCSLDEVVSFSHDAVFANPPGSSGIAMDVGQTLTMEQCLNAILIRSANEVSFAVAEHITGATDWSVFADIMNRRAEELGCLNSHFVNPNGLPDEEHYTTAYDLAMIGRAFFANEMLCKITMTRRLEIPVSDTLPLPKIENNSSQIIPGGTHAYEYLVGCKTGYTNASRSCLVSCAERDGMKLVCAVLRDETPLQYEDTISLFNYGFSNFEKINVSQTEMKYNMDDFGMFYGGTDIFGSSRPLLTLNRDDYIILPRTASFDDIDSAISYNEENREQVAVISYNYHGAAIGSVRVNFAAEENDSPIFDTAEQNSSQPQNKADKHVIFINIVRILTVLAGIGAILFIYLLIKALTKNYAFSSSGVHSWKKGRRRRRNMPWSGKKDRHTK